MKRALLAAACLLVVVGTADRARANYVFYTDRAAFDLATGGGLSSDTYGDFFNAASVSRSGYTLSQTSGGSPLQIYATGSGGAGYTDDGSGRNADFLFDSPINAFGVDITATGDMTVSVGGDLSSSISLTAGTASFFGVINTMTAFDQVTFSSSAGSLADNLFVDFDNLSFGPIETTAVVPEPSTFALLGIGGLALAGYGWRRKRQQAA